MGVTRPLAPLPFQATARFSTGLIELPEKHYVDGDRVELNKKVCFHSSAKL